VIAAGRRLVVANREELKVLVLAALDEGHPVVIDFAATDLIDSGGLGLTVMLHRHAERLALGFAIANLSDELRNLLRLTKLDLILTVVGSVEDALRGMPAGAPPADPDVAAETAETA